MPSELDETSKRLGRAFHIVEAATNPPRGEETGTLIFVHGWPDTHQVFEKQYKYFSELAKETGDNQPQRRYRIVSLVWPGYASPEDPISDTPSVVSLGYDFDSLLERFHNAIEEITTGTPAPAVSSDKKLRLFAGGNVRENLLVSRTKSAAPTPKSRPIVVCHDWGAGITWAYARNFPNAFSGIVGLDIGIDEQPVSSKPVLSILFLLTYQWVNMILFALSLLCKSICHVLPPAVPKFDFGNVIHRNVVMKIIAPRSSQPHAHVQMNYLYVQAWKHVLFPFIFGPLPVRPMRQKHASGKSAESRFPANVPILFMYSRKMPFYFHSEAFRDYCGKTLPKKDNGTSKCIGFDGSHWFYISPKHVNEVNKEMLTFFDKIFV